MTCDKAFSTTRSKASEIKMVYSIQTFDKVFWFEHSTKATFLANTFFVLTSSSGIAFDLPPTCTYTDASGINKTVMVQTLWYTCNDFFCIWGRWPSQLTLLDWLRAKLVLSLQASQLKNRVWNHQLCFWNVQIFQWCNFLVMLFSVVELIGLCFLLSSQYWQSLSEISMTRRIVKLQLQQRNRKGLFIPWNASNSGGSDFAHSKIQLKLWVYGWYASFLQVYDDELMRAL